MGSVLVSELDHWDVCVMSGGLMFVFPFFFLFF